MVILSLREGEVLYEHESLYENISMRDPEIKNLEGCRGKEDPRRKHPRTRKTLNSCDLSLNSTRSNKSG